MASALVNSMLDNLDEEDYRAAISFIEYLTSAKKKRKAEESEKILSEIQNIFEADKGWDSEESMLKEMAIFRRERMGL